MQNKAMGYLSLPAFQKLHREAEQRKENPPMTYGDRYMSRYGTKIPQVEHVFETEEDHYLFCAAHFHDEVGYRSHLVYPFHLCIMRAIHIKDWELLHHFVIQNKPFTKKQKVKGNRDEEEELRAVLDLNSVEGYLALNSDCPPISHGWTIKSLDFANFLLQEHDHSSYRYRFAADCPLKAVKERIVETNVNALSFCAGLAASFDVEKQKYCCEIIIDNKCQLSDCINVIAMLDDLNLFKSLLKEKEEFSLKVMSALIINCSSNIVAYVLSAHKRPLFPSNVAWVEINHHKCLTIPSNRIKKFLEIVNFNGSMFHRQLMIAAGLPITTDCTDDITDTTLSLIRSEDRDVVAARLVKKAGRVIFKHPVHLNKWILDIPKKFSISVGTTNINYPMCMKLIKLINGGVPVQICNFIYPPTVYIGHALNISSRPPFLTFPANDEDIIDIQMRRNNFSYIDYCLGYSRHILSNTAEEYSISKSNQLHEEVMNILIDAGIQICTADRESVVYRSDDELSKSKPKAASKKNAKTSDLSDADMEEETLEDEGITLPYIPMRHKTAAKKKAAAKRVSKSEEEDSSD